MIAELYTGPGTARHSLVSVATLIIYGYRVEMRGQGNPRSLDLTLLERLENELAELCMGVCGK